MNLLNDSGEYKEYQYKVTRMAGSGKFLIEIKDKKGKLAALPKEHAVNSFEEATMLAKQQIENL